MKHKKIYLSVYSIILFILIANLGINYHTYLNSNTINEKNDIPDTIIPPSLENDVKILSPTNDESCSFTMESIKSDLPSFCPTDVINFSFSVVLDNETTSLLLEYLLIDSRNKLICNSTADNNDYSLIIEPIHETFYLLIHPIDPLIPLFVSEVHAYGNHQGIVTINISITLPSQPVYLGKWSFNSTVSTVPTNQCLNSIMESFIVTDSCIFHINDFLITDVDMHSWIEVSSLNPSVVAPSDHLVITGFITDILNTTIIPLSTIVYRSYVKITMGTNEFYSNASFFNTSNIFHMTLPIEENNSFLISSINLTSIPFKGDIVLSFFIEIVTETFNQSVSEVLVLSPLPLTFPCDYLVCASHSDPFPSVIWAGETLNFQMDLYPVHVYNLSLPLIDPFIIPDINLNCYYKFNETHCMSKDLYWEQSGNRISLTGEFGSKAYLPYYYPSGQYFINLSCQLNQPIYNASSKQHLQFTFELKEAFDIITFDHQLGTITKNVSILYSNSDSHTLSLDIILRYFPSGVFASTQRRFWIGSALTPLWTPQYVRGELYQVIFNESFIQSIPSESIVLYGWIRHSNSSILRTTEGIKCHFSLYTPTSVYGTPKNLVERLLQDPFLSILICLIIASIIGIIGGFIALLRRLK